MKKVLRAVTFVLLLCGLSAPANWVLAESTPLFNDPVANLTAAKKKKAKHNYRTYTPTTISGDQNNADATFGSGSTHQYYRDFPIKGLKVSNPFAFYLMSKVDADQGFGEESWSQADNYFFTEGNIWVYYGYGFTYDGAVHYYDYAAGDYRYFSYYGGAKAKKRKNAAYKVYNYTVTGDENNADATAIPYLNIPNRTYYYRKLAVPDLETTKMVDFRVFRKTAADEEFAQDQWFPVNYDYFITNGYLYIPYGSMGNCPPFSDYYNNRDYRIFVYSDGLKKKNRLKKQYFKKYQFNVSNNLAAADKVANYGDSDYSTNTYYKKFALSGTKMNDFPNIQVIQKTGITSTFDADTWTPGNYLVTNGYIWINYGYDETQSGDFTSYDTGSGDYRVYVYK